MMFYNNSYNRQLKTACKVKVHVQQINQRTQAGATYNFYVRLCLLTLKPESHFKRAWQMFREREIQRWKLKLGCGVTKKKWGHQTTPRICFKWFQFSSIVGNVGIRIWQGRRTHVILKRYFWFCCINVDLQKLSMGSSTMLKVVSVMLNRWRSILKQSNSELLF